MMASPATCKTAIRSVDDVIKMMENPKAADHDILMLCQTPEDLLKLLTNMKTMPEWINVGNFGRIAPKRADGSMRTTYAPNLYLYDNEKETLKKVLALGIKTVYQTTPEDTPEPLDKLLG